MAKLRYAKIENKLTDNEEQSNNEADRESNNQTEMTTVIIRADRHLYVTQLIDQSIICF